MDNPYFNLEGVLSEFESATDRAAAIVGGAFLDDLLVELLKAFFVGDKSSDQKVFTGNRFLSTFSSRIELCYRLGLISKSEHRALHTVRDIRNRFAHQLGELSCTRQDIRALCANIEIPPQLVGPKDFFIPQDENSPEPPKPKFEKADSGNPRAVFEEAVIVYMHQLAARSASASTKNLKSPKDFANAVEMAECMVQVMEKQLARIEELEKMHSAGSGEAPPDDGIRERVSGYIRLQRYMIEQMKRLEIYNGSSRVGANDG